MGTDIIGIKLLYVLSFFFCVNGRGLGLASSGANGVQMLERSPAELKGANTHLFNVRSFGAQADGHTDDRRVNGLELLIIQPAQAEINPKWVSILSHEPSQQHGRRPAPQQGYLKATTDLSEYGFSAGWIEFGWMKGLTLTGGGTFDGQGVEAWPYNKCPINANCKLLPTNLKFIAMNKTVVRGITSVNSKFFHIALVECNNFKGSQIKISAPENSPNTDGIHIERSSGVYFSRSLIGTGDDCISVGQGNSQVTITSITCGPGHGISVGSLGKYPNEEDVSGLVVKDCTMTGTTNGIRIKTWANSPDSSEATNMTFENIVMNNVTNPIIIDQAYCPFMSCASKAPSRVKLSDIYFKNIRGTSLSAVAVTLKCSRGTPCQNIYLQDVHLDLSSGEKHATSSCRNVRVKYSGTQIPPPCA
ncbi:hypothetical protein VitviT2T_003283 [Vitis vinifera]|uniref:Exopolygalacturonase n=1 Tax=Vitis vinifera TaxID=29760 RepID=A0ABY9BMV5_VITVI|nr:hypothetical protein VitviT2T_003283 [Vitis vinifera]